MGQGQALRRSPVISDRSQLTVSVVVPTHNRASLLRALLDSLVRLEWDESRLEVWVVGDSDIRDETEAIVAKASAAAPFPIGYLLAPNSPAAKRNAGLRAAKGEIIAFTDDDCLVDAQWLRHACRAFADAAVAGVQGQTVVPPTEGNPACYHHTRQLMAPNFQTCNILYRRDALIAAAGFDERFTRAISEDSDLAFSVLKGGGRIDHCPDAVVYHPPREDNAWHILRSARHAYFAPLLYRKHPALYRQRLGSALPRSAWLYFALDGAAAASLALGTPALAGAALGAHALVLGAQAARHCRGDRSLRRVAATAVSLLIGPYVAYYFLAAGNLRFRSRLWW